MSASTDELSALLDLEGSEEPLSLPALDDSTPPQQDQSKNDSAQTGTDLSEVIQAIDATARGRLTSDFRKRICDLALPALALGATLVDVAADVGVNKDVLRGWLISIDEPAYREALAGQVGVQLAQFGAKMGAAIEDIENARQRTLDGECAKIGEGKDSRSVLIGPELAKIARARAGILSDASRLLHWQAEKRLPKLFSSDETVGDGPVRASFSFVINGQPAPAGRILQQGDRSINEQAPGRLAEFDITPVIGSVSAIPTLSEEVINSSPAPGADPIARASMPPPARENR